MNKSKAIVLRAEDFPKVPLVLDGISSRFIRENKIIPIEMKNNILKVIMADPGDREVVEALKVASAAEVISWSALMPAAT